MLADDIRRTFLAFFEARDHKLYPSSSLIPPPETNLMLTTAGMVQFRPYFLGTEKPSHPRATSVQKSFRTTDLEEVGDQTHLTLFEMLGNFSFGDYFKPEAIAWAWELLTTEFGLDPERLWATVYEEDDEAEQLWLEVTPIPAERIQRLGKNENFWDMGVAGPGGPNSEIWYDRGPAYGEEGGPAVNDTRYLEVYNLVFIQYETDGAKNIVKPLPAPSVDTGMGLERMATVLQEGVSAYDTDLFAPVLDRASELTGKPRGSDDASERLLRTLADHARSAAFLIADGVTPSNEGRGYVLRRVMRRAITKARLAGVNTKLLQELTEAVVERFGHVYPELQRNSEGIALVAAREEERFTQTLDIGLRILEESIEKATDVLPGNVAFKLQDTYGFPLDITKDVATERGLTVDVDGYERLMEEQRTRSREVGEAGKVRAGAGPRIDVAPTEFLGYEKRTDTGKVVAIAKGVEPAASLAPGSLSEIEETINTRVESDDKVTPFDTSYREAIDKYHAMAFFEEKYGDVVRVVEIGDYSYELCGGTHVPQTGHVGFVKLLGESSIGSNIRRGEALTGVEGLRWVNVRLREAERAAELVRTAPDELVAGIQRLLKTQKELERQIAAGQRSGISAAVNELVPTAQQIDSAQLVVARRTEEVGVLRELAVAVRDKIGRGAVILGTSGEGSVNLVAAVTKDLGVDARELLRPAAERIGGGAGGKPDLALAGGRNPEALDDALEVARQQAQGSLQ